MLNLKPIDKIVVYKIVNKYFSGNRAKLLNMWLVARLGEVGLLWNE